MPPLPTRLGLFGGTFDPPHVGHLVTAVNVRHALDLDVVVLMVANSPWQKNGTRPISSPADRLAMVEAAVADVEGLVAGDAEIRRGGPSFTADTLATIAKCYPDAELFTIVGDDAAAGITSWQRHEEVVAQSRLVVVDRPGPPVELPKEFDWLRVEVPRLDVSSTDLRARVRDGRPLDYLVTQPVLDIIAAPRLVQRRSVTSLSGRRRRNTFMALGAGIVALVIAPLLLYVGAVAITNSKAGQNALSNVAPEQAFPQTPTAMLATVSDSNELTSVTVFVLAPSSDPDAANSDQRGGSIVSVPINVDTGAGDQPISLHDSYAAGGEEGLRVDVESVLNVTLDHSAVMKKGEFAELLNGLPDAQVTFARDVLGADGAVLYPKGPTVLDAEKIAEVITTRSATQPERLREQNIEALWSGITSAIGTGLEGRTLSAGAPASFVELADRVVAGPAASRGLVARPLDASANPGGADVDVLDRPDAILVFASIAPAEMSRPASGLSYRLEAPPGFDQQVRKTIGALLALGGNVVSVDLNAEPHPDTSYLVYDPSIAAVEPTDNSLFGTITVETPDVRLSGVDETIRLGTTYLNSVDLLAADASSTTSSVPTTETTA